jgi:hypothetical protein
MANRKKLPTVDTIEQRIAVPPSWLSNALQLLFYCIVGQFLPYRIPHARRRNPGVTEAEHNTKATKATMAAPRESFRQSLLHLPLADESRILGRNTTGS